MIPGGPSRLGERALWYRHAWWFQWAHKPLCSAYSEDVVRVGRLRLCRSCVAAYLGATAALAGVLWLQPTVTTLVLAWLIVTTTVAVGSYPPLYQRHGRGTRDVLRGLLGASIPLALAPLWSSSVGTGIIMIGGLLGLRKIYGRIRATLGRTACASCEEMGRGICTGYSAQAISIRAYEEALAAQYLRAGFVPKSLTARR